MPKDREISADARRALVYWGAISRAAVDNMTTADLWSAIRDEAERLGLASPGVTVRGVSELRGIAKRIEANAQDLAGMPRSRRLLGRLVTVVPWARPAAQRRVNPMVQVRFRHTFTVAGETHTEWRTSKVNAHTIRTVGDLQDQVDEDAELMARKYLTAHVGVSDIHAFAI